jgi:hypothetical protein
VKPRVQQLAALQPPSYDQQSISALLTHRDEEPDTDPDEEEYEKYTGNEGSYVE